MTANETKLRPLIRRLWRSGRWLGAALILGAILYRVRFAPVPVEGVFPIPNAVVSREVMGTGTLEARISSTISPKIAGKIGRVHADQGETVEKDQLLVQLEDEDFQQQVEVAKANSEAAQAALQRLIADRSRSVAVLERATRHDFRTQSLLRGDAVSREAGDESVESLAIATADLARAQAAITEGQKEFLAAERTLEYHRARLADTVIKAPFAGLIVTRHREAGDIAVPGTAVLTLISTEVLWVSAWVDETEISTLAPNQPARVVFRSQPKRSYPGRVIRVGKQADRETRELVVDVQVSEIPENWAVGQRAEVYIETDRRVGVLAIPLSVVNRRNEQDGVYIAKNGVAHWKPVKLGVRGGATAEVKDGLIEEDAALLAIAGATSLAEGQRVRIK